MKLDRVYSFVTDRNCANLNPLQHPPLCQPQNLHCCHFACYYFFYTSVVVILCQSFSFLVYLCLFACFPGMPIIYFLVTGDQIIYSISYLTLKFVTRAQISV